MQTCLLPRLLVILVHTIVIADLIGSATRGEQCSWRASLGPLFFFSSSSFNVCHVFVCWQVIAQVKRRWQYSSFRPRANSYTATTVSVRQVRFLRLFLLPVTFTISFKQRSNITHWNVDVILKTATIHNILLDDYKSLLDCLNLLLRFFFLIDKLLKIRYIFYMRENMLFKYLDD